MINFHHILPEYYSNTFNYYFYSRVDTRQEPINRIKAISRYHAAVIFAKNKNLPLKSFLQLYAVSR